jgi:hypothetical protein
MADGSRPDFALASAGDLVAAIKSFAGEHGGANASIEYLGKRGARVVLAGADGDVGDLAASGIEAARTACEQAGVSVDNGWERELNELTRPSHDLWRSRARRTLTR